VAGSTRALAGWRGQGRVAAAPRVPRPPHRPRQSLPPRCGGTGGGAATATMPHRHGQDRDTVTSSRFRAAAARPRRGTP